MHLHALKSIYLVHSLAYLIMYGPFANIPELDCLNIDTTCFKNTVNCSALFILGFLAETSS